MNVAFRADASSRIGHGHVMRCLTLAEALRTRGAGVRFVCRVHDGHLADVIQSRGFHVHRLSLDPVERSDERPAHASWLGTDWRSDADATRMALGAIPPDWLVVDHYALDERWQRALRSAASRIMVIDDLADRRHDCDLLVDQNLIDGFETRYEDLVPRHTRLLLGPEFTLLQPIYSRLHQRIPPREGRVRRILIFFGGADAHNITGSALRACLRLGRQDIQVDVVTAPNSPHAATIRELASDQSGVRVIEGGVPSLAPLMAQADLAIGAGGATSWERLCLGLPAIVVTLAENQRAIAASLHSRGLVRWLGDVATGDEDALLAALQQHVAEQLPRSWSERCLDSVDGAGAERVCSALLDGPAPLTATPVTRDDARQLVERGAQPAEWIDTHMRDVENCHLYYATTPGGVRAGLLHAHMDGEAWHIETTGTPWARGLGIGTLQAVAVAGVRRDQVGAVTFGPQKGDVAALRIGVCSDHESWINESVPAAVATWLGAGHQVTWSHDAEHLPGGDICFYLSYGRIVGHTIRHLYRNNLVVHASALPLGRGWSPLTWQVLEGAQRIPVTLFEAEDAVDSGDVYLETMIELNGSELIQELRRLLTGATFDLCSKFIAEYPAILQRARPQAGEPTYYRKRGPSDARLDPDRPLREQLNLLRVSDNERYPAWVEMNGVQYALRVSARDQ